MFFHNYKNLLIPDSDLSPKSSPHSPDFNAFSSSHHRKLSENSTTATKTISITTTERNSTLLDEDDDKYSTIKTPNKKTEAEETRCLAGNREVKYSEVDRSLKESIGNRKAYHDETAEQMSQESFNPDVPYAVVDRSLKKSNITATKQVETPSETLTSSNHSTNENCEKTILINENSINSASLNTDFPEYAVVDLVKKRMERQNKAFLDEMNHGDEETVETSTTNSKAERHEGKFL